MVVSRIVEIEPTGHLTREAEPSPYPELVQAIREAVQAARAAQQPPPGRMKLRLPDLGGFGITEAVVGARREGPLIVLDGTPAEYTKFAVPFARAIGITEAILGVADLSRDPLTANARAATWVLLDPKVVYLDRNRVTLTEAWREGPLTYPAYIDSLAHELVHVRWPTWGHETAENAVRRYLRFGELPHDRSPWDQRLTRQAL